MSTAAKGVTKGKYGDLSSRLWFLLGALVVFRIGAHIPVPGIDPIGFGGFVQVANKRHSGHVQYVFGRRVVALYHICPGYHAVYFFIDHHAVGRDSRAAPRAIEEGRRSRTPQDYPVHPLWHLGLGDVSGIWYLGGIANATRAWCSNPGPMFQLTTVITLVTGTMFLMWLGEQITERGLGNGISLIIFAGIAAGLPRAIGSTLELARTGAFSIPLVLALFFGAIAVTALVVFVERGQRKILVNYAKRQVGNKVYGGQSSHLPLKLNMSGVIPPIFASSIILFPATIAGWFGSGQGMNWLKDISDKLSPGQPIYVLFYAGAIVFFCFFYTALVFSPKDTADNLKKSGAFLPGIRPGEQTAQLR